jgi:hypothetical protein
MLYEGIASPLLITIKINMRQLDGKMIYVKVLDILPIGLTRPRPTEASG